VDEVLRDGLSRRDGKWTESIAIGDEDFIKQTKTRLGAKAIGRKAMENIAGYELKELQAPYNSNLTAKKLLLQQPDALLQKIDSHLFFLFFLFQILHIVCWGRF